MAIRIAETTRYTGNKIERLVLKNTSEKTIPVTNSTKGYCKDILLPHSEHLPFKKRKLSMGKSSYHFNSLPQEKHFDLPLTKESPVLYLRTTTFKKLPIIAPNIKNIKKLIKGVLNIKA
jgi:hypothetical protein